MKKILWLGLLVTPYICVPAWAQVVETTVQWEAANPGVVPPWETAAGFPAKEEVFQDHDRFPGHGRALGRDRDVTTPDNECNENHNLKPDGDGDCDDPKSSVPEPGTGPLAALAMLGMGWVWLRRRK